MGVEDLPPADGVYAGGAAEHEMVVGQGDNGILYSYVGVSPLPGFQLTGPEQEYLGHLKGGPRVEAEHDAMSQGQGGMREMDDFSIKESGGFHGARGEEHLCPLKRGIFSPLA